MNFLKMLLASLALSIPDKEVREYENVVVLDSFKLLKIPSNSKYYEAYKVGLIHTIKPLDEALILERARKAHTVVTMEEHTVIGGLGGAVAELLAENLGPAMPRFRKLGLADAFARNYGGQDDLLAINGLQPDQVARTVENDLLQSRVA